MEPKQIDVYSEGMDKLMYQWKDSPNMQAFLSALLSQLETVQTTFYQLLNERGIYTAIGAQLDLLGKLVGESRQGRSDAIYREAILGRITVNAASGTPEDIKHTARVVSGADYAYMYEHYPACNYVFVPAFVSLDNAKAIERSHAAGVRARTMWSEEPENVVFPGLDDDTNLINLITEDGDDYIVTVGDTEYLLLLSYAVTPIGDTYFTSLVPGTDTYEVVDEKGKLAALSPQNVVEYSTGFIIDNNGNYVVDNNNQRIRYTLFE